MIGIHDSKSHTVPHNHLSNLTYLVWLCLRSSRLQISDFEDASRVNTWWLPLMRSSSPKCRS